MNKYTNPKICSLPTAQELHAQLAATDNSTAREQIAKLFDANTFVETSTFAKRGISDFIATERTSELEGVITGYGAIGGRLVFAFVEDAERMGGAIDERHAKKIVDLYRLALTNGAPVIGVFNSKGIDVFQGTAGLAAYGKIIATVSKASGVIPQIALVAGKCIGTSATVAAMFDIVVKTDSAELYVTSPALTGKADAQAAIVHHTADEDGAIGFTKAILSFLPDNASSTIEAAPSSDNLNRLLGDLDFGGEGLAVISTISDNGVFFELSHGYAPEAVTAFATIGGVKCGIVANSFAVNEGRLSAAAARKIARFVSLCDSFSIPVVTLVDSLGLAIDKNGEEAFAAELARLAVAYASSTCPKVTVILGHAIGASFILLGSKALGADVTYSLDSAEIGALPAESGVAFAWDKYITEEKTRESLVSEWLETVSSPVVAASSGEIDDIISVNEMRARICSALLMLCAKSDYRANHKVLPL